MVGPAQPQPPTQPAAAPAAAAATASSSAEDEAIKRNTDCVYFLASPLTCKKGSECEYRHSDMARLNPRDCWYWLNGNCLNPKCAFRHPPLDGLFGSQVPTPTGSSQPQKHFATTPAINVPNTLGKQGVLCVFFQKGFCLKGDRCQFLHSPSLHVPNIQNNKSIQAPGPTSATEQPTSKKPLGGLEKCSQEKLAQSTNVPKSIGLPVHSKPVPKISYASQENEYPVVGGVAFGSEIVSEPHSHRPSAKLLRSNGNQGSSLNHAMQPTSVDDNASMNDIDTEEISREPSPGFDVLVDDERGDPDYYHDEDRFGRTRGREGRRDYDLGHSVEYRSIADIDKDAYHDIRDYDSFDRLEGQYAWEQRRASSERMSGGSTRPERRQHARDDGADQIVESDLRYRLSKQKRPNGLRSVIGHDYTRERRDEDRGHYGSLGNRLRGRIKMPGRSRSPSDVTTRHMSPPGRLQLPFHQGRLRDRINGRVQDDRTNSGAISRGPKLREDSFTDNTTDFAGPRSLAELKNRKTSDCTEQHADDHQSLGKRKYQKFEDRQQHADDLSFEGPMPLEEILKRKRRVRKQEPESSSNNGRNNEKQMESSDARLSSLPNQEDDIPTHGNKEEFNDASGDMGGKTESADGLQPSQPQSVEELAHEEGMIAEEGADNEGYDQGDDEFDYEQVDDEGYNLDDGENGDPEDEYLGGDDDDDDDDADDFAKKMGVMFS